jgi:hypothetical protein
MKYSYILSFKIFLDLGEIIFENNIISVELAKILGYYKYSQKPCALNAEYKQHFIQY